jgi:hypothetical protein
MLSYLLTALFFGAILYIFNQRDQHVKVSRNKVSTVHASGVVAAYFLSIDPTYIIYWSTSYYVIDTLFELGTRSYDFKKKLLKIVLEYAMVFHHLVSIGVVQNLTDPHVGDIIFAGLYLAEISNFPMYVVYHLKAIKSERHTLIKCLIVLEIVFNVYFRLYTGSFFFYRLATSGYMTMFMLFATISMYLLSIFWTVGLCQQLMPNQRDKSGKKAQ